MKAILLATAIALASLAPAHSQEISPVGTCDKYETIVKYLKDNHGQVAVFRGPLGTSGDDIIEIFIAGDSSFSFVRKTKSGLACIMGSGLELVPVLVGDPA